MLENKCLRCLNLRIGEFGDGMGLRCGKGFYDKGVPTYYSTSGLARNTTVAVWKAQKECGDNFSPMKNTGREIRLD